MVTALPSVPCRLQAPGEAKILTIAVEMASGSPVLFLDEPTTGASCMCNWCLHLSLRCRARHRCPMHPFCCRSGQPQRRHRHASD